MPKAIVVIAQELLKVPHICFVCEEPIAPGAAIKLTWSAIPIGGLGYFHITTCADSMIRSLSQTHKAVHVDHTGDRTKETPSTGTS